MRLLDNRLLLLYFQPRINWVFTAWEISICFVTDREVTGQLFQELVSLYDLSGGYLEKSKSLSFCMNMISHWLMGFTFHILPSPNLLLQKPWRKTFVLGGIRKYPILLQGLNHIFIPDTRRKRTHSTDHITNQVINKPFTNTSGTSKPH